MVQRYNPDYVMHAARFAPFARENEHGEFVKFSDYEVLKAERDAQQKRADALAVENAALKEFIKKKCFVVPAGASCLAEADECAEGSMPETPATSAALAAIEAWGVEKYAELFKETVNMERKHNQEFYNGTVWFAKQLREGK